MSTAKHTLDLYPVYEFRPLPGRLQGPVRRYAGGQWLADDGEYDLAFVSGLGAPICLYVEVPYQRNIVFKWYSRHWSNHEPMHPGGNAWHHVLREGATGWGGDWGSDRHENSLVSRKGMDLLVSETRCANGHGVDLDEADPHVLAGLVRERDTKNVFVLPEPRICHYCGADHAEHLAKATGTP